MFHFNFTLISSKDSVYFPPKIITGEIWDRFNRFQVVAVKWKGLHGQLHETLIRLLISSTLNSSTNLLKSFCPCGGKVVTEICWKQEKLFTYQAGICNGNCQF